MHKYTQQDSYDPQPDWWHFHIAPVQSDEVGVLDPCVFSQGFADHNVGEKKNLLLDRLFK